MKLAQITMLALSACSAGCTSAVDLSYRHPGPFCLDASSPGQSRAERPFFEPGEYELTRLRPGMPTGPPGVGAVPDTVRGRLIFDRLHGDSLLGHYVSAAEAIEREPALRLGDTLFVGCVLEFLCEDGGTTVYVMADSSDLAAWGRWSYDYSAGIAYPIDRRGRVIRSISGPFCIRRVSVTASLADDSRAKAAAGRSG